MVRQKLLSVQEEAELMLLWGKRSCLDKASWDRLWHLTTKALLKCNPSILNQLPDTRQDYVTDFFLNKVMQDKFSNSELTSVSALATFFQRYLIDVHRALQRRPTISIDDEALLDHMADSADAEQACGCAGNQPDSDVEAIKLLESATVFFKSLTEEDQLYLALHTCNDEGEALYKLAERLKIASHHYKAGQLGITRKKGELHEGYEKTRIGSWLSGTLGILLVPESAKDILDAFIALCQAAFFVRTDLVVRG